MVFRKRILSIIIDYIFFMLLFFLISVPIIYDQYFVPLDNKLDKIVYLVYGLLFVISFLLFICKDAIKGQSIGKKFTKLIVVSENQDKPRLWQLIIRNITVLIWPIEAILLLLGKKRIGDILSKTDVILLRIG